MAAEPQPQVTLTRFLRLKNVTKVRQHIGSMEFQPGEVREVPDRMAKGLVALGYFEFTDEPLGPIRKPTPGLPPEPVASFEFAKEVRHAIWPDPPLEEWVQHFNQDVFPCQSREWDPIEPCERPFSISFRLHDLTELHGGARVILRLCGYLLRRGHEVALSILRTALKQEHLEGIPLVLTDGLWDADFVVGTFWTTVNELAGTSLSGRKLALLQSDEPSWMQPGDQGREQAERALKQGDFSYIAISKQVADSCEFRYGTKCVGVLPGNGVDSLDFSPRLNHHDRRNGVCAIYRGPWFKNDTFAISLMAALKERVPRLRVEMAGFKRFANPALDRYLHEPCLDDMAMMYSTADFYISGSRIEGSPLPPLEAAACGCIPAVTRIGTCEYLEDGVNGLILNADKPQEALDRMLAVYADDNLRRTLLRNALRTARQRPWRLLCESFEAILSGMAT